MSASDPRDRRRVVVTGIGVVSPLGCGKADYFRRLEGGVSGIGPLTLFEPGELPSRLAAQVKADEADALFRAELLRPEGESADWDRQTVFGLAAVRQAINDAQGEVFLQTYAPDRIALCLGVGMESVCLDQLANWLGRDGSWTVEARGRRAVSPLQHTPDRVAALIRERFPLAGRTVVNISACVAGAQAVGQAFRLIRAGLADAAVCGGADSMIHPLGLLGFILLGATTRSNERGAEASCPFDRRRDGFVLGEGAGVLVLEPEARARGRGAHVYAEIAGYAATLDAYKVTDPEPSGEGAYQAMRGALADAVMDPAEVDYINAHGTSTPMNDRVETRAIKRLLGPRAARVPVSSTKSMMGHAIASAGPMELIAALACFERGFLPPTINYREPDPDCDLDYVPNQSRPVAGVRGVLCNSFGFGGQNAVLVLRGG